jgi:hypothetical protein
MTTRTALRTFPGLARAVFDTSGTRLAGLVGRHGASGGAPVRAEVRDVETGARLMTTDDAHWGSNYAVPSCSFSVDDHGAMLLADGGLWDVRAGTLARRFDKLSVAPLGVGAFHPNGVDVLLDGAVWDVRSPRLLRVIPALEQTVVLFAGDVLYAYAPPVLDDLLALDRSVHDTP